MMSLGLQARALSIVKLQVYSSCAVAQANARLSGYAEGLPGEAKTRYLEKLYLLNGLDPFLLASNVGPKNDSPSTCDIPPVEATDLVSFLVLETSFVTAKQFKAHKSMEAYNQFVSGWVKEVCAWNINHKSVVTGRASFIHCL